MKKYFCRALLRVFATTSITIIIVACGGGTGDPFDVNNQGEKPDGTLSIADAPASIGTKFTSTGTTAVGSDSVIWTGTSAEGGTINFTVTYSESTGKLTSVSLIDLNATGNILNTGSCTTIIQVAPCEGVVLDTTAGKVSFSNTKLRLALVSDPRTSFLVTLNGSLTYTPKTTTSTTNTSTSPSKVSANGSLTVANASAEFGTLFAASTAEVTLKDSKVVFKDSATDFTKQKVFIVGKAPSPNQPIIANLTGSGQTWLCSQPPTCTGITMDMAAGTVTFANTTLPAYAGIGKSVTVNGTLTFTPVTK